ncbi:hypothetical protein TCAL_07672 [Tigriopus californicus]|uniref:Uncharacterized protein n=1 Tax=Tigriopus californicus TaxID=6832 RepID=A0A553NS44_TIGCA|nr:hypothetical protein TCAL_07672 [Tigriopus californicus]
MLASLQQKGQEKVLLAQYYPLLRRVTSAEGTPQDLPAYAFQELIQLSYQSPPVAQALASYLAVEALRQKATLGRLKTLKVLDQLTRHGSKYFRRALRLLDEHLRAASQYSVTAHAVTGSSWDEAVRALARDIRLFLFEEALINSDEVEGHEEPLQAVPSLGGLGSSGHRGKYEGFGHAPLASENLGHRILNTLENALTSPDERAEVMAMCLKSDPGGYTPVSLTTSLSSESDPPQRQVLGLVTPVRTHIPGRAGGGWESSDEDEVLAEKHQLKQMAALKIDSSEDLRPDSDTGSDSANMKDETPSVEEAVEARPDETAESMILGEFLDAPGLSELNNISVIYLIKKNLSEMPSSEFSHIRALLLLEHYLRSELVHIEVYHQNILPILQTLSQDDNHLRTQVTVKAKKLCLFIARLKSLRKQATHS